MTYELAHRPRMESTADLVAVDSASSWEAVEQLGKMIPDEHVILYDRLVS
ncbi:hypothetical protein [Clavibacter phaseoli]|nr:hypothetical protein [Clavibacter phaseoli]